MNKRQLIDQIASINLSAKPAFLATFCDRDLDEYLRHLRGVYQAASPPRGPRDDRQGALAVAAPVGSEAGWGIAADNDALLF